jgi:hypothetical protein
MNLMDFLLARTVEDLQEQRCDFEQESNGDLRCLCQEPTPQVDALFDQAKLIRECSEIRSHEFMLRLLADRYATHSDYRPEWHRIDDIEPRTDDHPGSWTAGVRSRQR